VSSLVEIGSRTANARDLTTWWRVVTDSLRISDKDAPFALLYAATSDATPDISSVSSPGSSSTLEECVLKGSIGVEADHPIAPATLDMLEGSYSFLPHMLDAARLRQPTLVHLDDLALPESFLSGIDWKGYGDPCRSVIICPILPTTSEHLQGFLILGVNPRRPYDDDYQQFVQVLIRLLATSLAAVVLFDEEIRQKENAIGQAARIQEQLMSELDMKERKFQRFAERSDVAIFIINPQTRKYIYRNQRWYDLFQVEINNDTDDASQIWSHVVPAEDLPLCEAIFAMLFVDRVPVSFEIKTKLPWSPPAESHDPDLKPQEHFTWILCSAYLELGANDEVIEIVGNVTDVSKLKWAEGIQRLRTESALESKKHLELFIDSTSHEMRNPLSAIMQCADGIVETYSLPDGALKRPDPTDHDTHLGQTLDSALTIAQCAQHMVWQARLIRSSFCEI
jgi:PAS domain-containing protein